MKKNILRVFMLCLMTILAFTGCTSANKYIEDTLNPSLNIQDIKFGMSVQDVEALIGNSYEESPCVYGYEHTYSELGLVVGFDKKDKVRKLIVKSGSFNVFDITDGSSKEDAVKLLTSHEFTEKSPGEYACENVAIKFLTDSNSVLTGISVERVEE